jgi:hypothetical protein
MTPEQLERKRKYDREYSAKRYAEVKGTPEFKTKCKLVRENFTKEQREQRTKSSRESAVRRRAENPEKARVARCAINKKYFKTDKGYLTICKNNLAKRLGVSAKDLPDELVAAKFAQLKVIRLVRDLG